MSRDEQLKPAEYSRPKNRDLQVALELLYKPKPNTTNLTNTDERYIRATYNKILASYPYHHYMRKSDENDVLAQVRRDYIRFKQLELPSNLWNEISKPKRAFTDKAVKLKTGGYLRRRRHNTARILELLSSNGIQKNKILAFDHYLTDPNRDRRLYVINNHNLGARVSANLPFDASGFLPNGYIMSTRYLQPVTSPNLQNNQKREVEHRIDSVINQLIGLSLLSAAQSAGFKKEMMEKRATYLSNRTNKAKRAMRKRVYLNKSAPITAGILGSSRGKHLVRDLNQFLTDARFKNVFIRLATPEEMKFVHAERSRKKHARNGKMLAMMATAPLHAPVTAGAVAAMARGVPPEQRLWAVPAAAVAGALASLPASVFGIGRLLTRPKPNKITEENLPLHTERVPTNRYWGLNS